MDDPLFVYALIVLTVLGISESVIEWLFWKRLRHVDPEAGQRLLGVDLSNRRAAGIRRIWRLFLKREYTRVTDRQTTRLGDIVLVSLVIFYVTLISFFAALVARVANLV